MNTHELIKEAAEDMYEDTYFEEHRKHYSYLVTNFLSFAKQRGMELVDVSKNDEETAVRLYEEKYGKFPGMLGSNEGAVSMIGFIKKSLAIGAARERERMMKFIDWLVKREVSPIGNGKWEDSFGQPEGVLAVRTTSELLDIFNQENKEG